LSKFNWIQTLSSLNNRMQNLYINYSFPKNTTTFNNYINLTYSINIIICIDQAHPYNFNMTIFNFHNKLS